MSQAATIAVVFLLTEQLIALRLTGQANLAESPSLAGQAAYVAIQIRTAPAAVNASGVEAPAVAVARLRIYDGLGWVQLPETAAPAPLSADGEWTLLTICALVRPSMLCNPVSVCSSRCA